MPRPGVVQLGLVLTAALLLLASARCKNAEPTAGSSPARAVLRVGVGPFGTSTLVQNMTVEGLTTVADNGRVRPWLASDVTVSPDHHKITISLRPNVRFHDGSPITPELVANILRENLRQFAGKAYEDVKSIDPVGPDRLDILLNAPSQFVLEALDVLIQKPGAAQIGTGPFMARHGTDHSTIDANPNYYLGSPAISRISVVEYPSVRTAWAELLRGNLDMLYELDVNAVDLLQTSTKVNVYWATRRYQYVVILNLKVPALRSAAIRRALNMAVDRDALIRDALGGHGIPSSGPIWPHHWAAQSGLPELTFDPDGASRLLPQATRAATAASAQSRLHFTCLVAPDAERVSLVLKRQLQAVGVDMALDEVSRDEFIARAGKGDFEAILSSAISGPSIVRPFLWWDTHGTRNRGAYSDSAVDAALDQVRHATSDAQYALGVARFQKAILDDPPAIFLAWDETARAVSNDFEVVNQPGTDIIRTLHLWRPVADARNADKN